MTILYSCQALSLHQWENTSELETGYCKVMIGSSGLGPRVQANVQNQVLSVSLKSKIEGSNLLTNISICLIRSGKKIGHVQIVDSWQTHPANGFGP